MRKRTILPTRKKVLAEIKKNNEDFEWYPTTDEMLDEIRVDLLRTNFSDTTTSRFHDSEHERNYSILDIGAGDGRALEVLGKKNGKKYIIEKSQILLNQNKEEHIILGTDFNNLSLMDKEVDVIFCNPPYSEYSHWSERILSEGMMKVVYLVIPQRWINDVSLQREIKRLGIKPEVIHSGDFLNADRSARAKIDIVKFDFFNLFRETRYGSVRKDKSDSFDYWFDNVFIDESSTPDYDSANEGESLKEKVSNQLTAGRNLIDILVDLYNNELNHIFSTYKKISGIDSVVLKEMGISRSNVKSFLKNKISGLKKCYWTELFSKYETITGRLTSDTLEDMKKEIVRNRGIEFSSDNAYAVTGWVIRNANKYYDSQLISYFEKLIDECNVNKYKSNTKVFSKEEWRWMNTHERREVQGKVMMRLDYRIVCSEGGIHTGDYMYNSRNGLTERAYNFISDSLIIGRNLGFDILSNQDLDHHGLWTSGKMHTFKYMVESSDTGVVMADFMTVRAYKKGTLHIKYNTDFLKKLNILHGKLKGWVKSKGDIVEEMSYSEEDADKYFNDDVFKLGNKDTLKLLGN